MNFIVQIPGLFELPVDALYKRALLLTDHDPQKLFLLNEVGTLSMLRHRVARRQTDLDQAISAYDHAVRLTLAGSSDMRSRSKALGDALFERYTLVHDQGDLDRLIAAFETVVRLTPDRDADRPAFLTRLGGSLRCRFDLLGNVTDIDKSIELEEEAVRLTADGDADKPGLLHTLGDSLRCRFELLGNVANIDQSIELEEKAVRLTPDGDIDKPSRLNSLGHSLLRRFESQGDMADIEHSIEFEEEAVRLTPDGDADKPGRLNNLGISFLGRFERLGSVADIDKSIELHEKAVRLAPDKDTDKPSLLNNLGGSLNRRFELLGSVVDTDRSIELQAEAVRLTPDGHANKPGRLSNLGLMFLRRFDRLGNVADIDRSITIIEEAVGLTPDGHADKPGRLNNLGASLLRRFDRVGNLADIGRSIELKEKAVTLTPDGNASKPDRLNYLGTSLLSRFERLGNLADLNKAIAFQEETVRLSPDGYVDRPIHLGALGISLLYRFKRLRNVVDLNSATLHFSRAAISPTGSPPARFHSAVNWAVCNRIVGVSSMDAYGYALELLPRLAWLGLPLTGRHDELVKIGSVVCEAAAVAVEEGHLHTAMEWLEQGRSIVWGQLLNLRTPVHALRERDSDLADRLERTSVALGGASAGDAGIERGGHVSLEEAGRNHRALALEWDELVGRVRTIPGFEDFLRPKRLSHLRSAARSGPVVVINIHERRCDALILRADREDVTHVPLASFSYDRAKDLQVSLDKVLSASGIRRGSPRDPVRIDSHVNGGGFEEILSELWLHIVKPVLDSLDLQISGVADPPRIWWCPTGPLTFLPLHAAGLYDKDEPGHKISDFVTSSYTPTLTALLDPSQPNRHNEFELLAITQPSTPGQAYLPGTETELSRIQERAGKLRIRSLRGAEATVGRVVEAMKQCGWIHLACHGAQDIVNPTNSAFLLQDGQLALSEIITAPLPHAELAFLSACQTATGDRRLSEEAVHLAAGMLLAGYRSVIATTWSIKDNDGPIVAEEVYARLFKNKSPDSAQAAHALHHAVRRLREAHGASFISWVPFIHVGM